MDNIKKSLNAFIEAKQRMKSLLEHPKCDVFAMMRASSEIKSSRDLLVKSIMQDKTVTALQALTLGERPVTLTRSAQKPGQWQITRFDLTHSPLGDSHYTRIDCALDDFFRECNPATIRLRSSCSEPMGLSSAYALETQWATQACS